MAFLFVPERPELLFLALVLTAKVGFVLNPLLKGDGYWFLVDAAGWHNLRTRGFADLRRRRISGPAAYALAVVVFTAGLVVVNLVVVTFVLGLWERSIL